MATSQVKGLDAKQRILIATIEVIKIGGMRGVRHRAVAAMAEVSLGSTTYHFKNIDDLICSTFEYWHKNLDIGKNPHFKSISHDVLDATIQDIGPQELAGQIFEDAERYLRGQIFDHSDDRRVELAFHNEALRNPSLSRLLQQSWKKEIQRICKLYQMMGTSYAQEDAEITFALVLQLEKKAILLQDQQELEDEFKKMRLILKRHIYLMVGASLEP